MLRARAVAFDHEVAFEDETLVSDDYGVVDKADTPESQLWECHSDNGTVRQCSLPKDD